MNCFICIVVVYCFFSFFVLVFFDEFLLYFENIVMCFEFLVIVGDFNFYMDLVYSKDVVIFNELLEIFGFL